MQEGKLLGNIISKGGIKKDPNTVATILKIETPRSKREEQCFLGRGKHSKEVYP